MSPMAFALMILSMFFIVQNIDDQIHQINAENSSQSKPFSVDIIMVLLDMLSIHLHNVHDKSKRNAITKRLSRFHIPKRIIVGKTR